MSERLIFGVIKTIVPCVEGDRSDYQPSTTTIVLSLRLRATDLSSSCKSDLSPSAQGMVFKKACLKTIEN